MTRSIRERLLGRIEQDEAKKSKPKTESYTPFLAEARDGDEFAQFSLNVMLAHHITDASQVEAMGQQEKARLLSGNVGNSSLDETVPLTEEELKLQAQMRYFLPKEKKYNKRKPK